MAAPLRKGGARRRTEDSCHLLDSSPSSSTASHVIGIRRSAALSAWPTHSGRSHRRYISSCYRPFSRAASLRRRQSIARRKATASNFRQSRCPRFPLCAVLVSKQIHISLGACSPRGRMGWHGPDYLRGVLLGEESGTKTGTAPSTDGTPTR
jgi:hypothetical protein